MACVAARQRALLLRCAALVPELVVEGVEAFFRDAHGDGAFAHDFRLTAEAGAHADVEGLVEDVLFVFFGFARVCTRSRATRSLRRSTDWVSTKGPCGPTVSGPSLNEW